MVHPLVLQLRFTRNEFKRALEGVTDVEARRRFTPMNCISWNIGHMAWHEQRYWLIRGQDIVLLPELQEQFARGAPASQPELDRVLEAWHTITAAADPWLDTLTTGQLFAQHTFTFEGQQQSFNFGTLMQRVIYHYWYHTGENLAIRQVLGHKNLPEFVGNIDDEAPYLPEAG